MNQNILKAKQETVEKIVSFIKKSSSVILFEYRGLTVSELTELRKEFKKQKNVFSVYKNKLMNKAFEKLNINLNSSLIGPNAIVFSPDLTSSSNILLKFSKLHDKLIVKSGIIKGKIVNSDEITVIANLPSKEGLIAKFCCCLKSPIVCIRILLGEIVKKLSKKEG